MNFIKLAGYSVQKIPCIVAKNEFLCCCSGLQTFSMNFFSWDFALCYFLCYLFSSLYSLCSLCSLCPLCSSHLLSSFCSLCCLFASLILAKSILKPSYFQSIFKSSRKLESGFFYTNETRSYFGFQRTADSFSRILSFFFKLFFSLLGMFSFVPLISEYFLISSPSFKSLFSFKKYSCLFFSSPPKIFSRIFLFLSNLRSSCQGLFSFFSFFSFFFKMPLTSANFLISFPTGNYSF